ncbi:MAG: HTH domain-containing protein [Clostridiales bacterium]|jgi:predicted DNA-binding transcriptional regulator YafY|nr:HTH domain-containing protein [Clostridiales bacterium]
MWAIMLKMLMEFMTEEKLTTQYFVDKHEKSTRTVMRYIDKMRENGIPIDSVRGRNGGFYLENTIRLNEIFFTDGEIADIVYSARKCLPHERAEAIERKMTVIKSGKKTN